MRTDSGTAAPALTGAPRGRGAGARPEPGGAEFDAIRAWLHRETGIALGDSKRALVAGRLWSRLAHAGCGSYADYLAHILEPGNARERQAAIDHLTTNETHFFREPRHFELLAREAIAGRPPGRALRAWSAACSSGEEPYSMAMTLAAALGEAWEIVASDVSARMLERARAGHYPMARAERIPADLLRAYCLKGVRAQTGTFVVGPEIRRHVAFHRLNLMDSSPHVGLFDVVFLRNVLIYFDAPTKQRIARRVAASLRPGGLLFVGHAETLAGAHDGLRAIAPSVYRLG